jgi:plastocyanin
MRRALTALLLVVVAAAGAGTAALARKAPPRHHHKPIKHRHHHKPAKKPAHKPSTTTTPSGVTPVAVTTPTTLPSTTPPATTPDPASPTDTTTTPAAPLAHALGVTASDAPGGGFVLSLSRTVLGSGLETVNFVNRSQDGHDLEIDAAGGAMQQAWDELASLADPVTKTVVLAPGTYRVYCTLHSGMEKQLTVQAG